MDRVLFCGGDRREVIAALALAQQEFRVSAFGIPEELLSKAVRIVKEPAEALCDTDICILPQPPVGRDGRLISLLPETVFLRKNELAGLRHGTPVICGAASPYLRDSVGHCCLIELAEDDELARLLAPASAEGAIAEAMHLSPGLLAGKRALVIGFGRIGKELSWRLRGLGAQVLVLNRGRKRAEEASALGYPVADRSQLVSAALHTDYIFNTAPSLLLDEQIISLMPQTTCIIDLAAAPGGTDLKAAAARGLRAIHAGGLPGKYAPEYAGQIMAQHLPALIHRLLHEEVTK